MSLISHFPFNGNAVDRVGGRETTPRDIDWVGSNFDQGAGFNGTTSKIAIIMDDILSSLRQTLSISLWFQTDAELTQAKYLFCRNNNTANDDISYAIYLTGSGKVVFMYDGVGHAFDITVNVGSPHHIALSIGSEGVDIYFDGERVYSTPFTGLCQDKPYLNLGGRAGTNSYILDGWIADVRIYDHKLSPFEVLWLSKAPVCHYSLEDTGIGLHDKIGLSETLRPVDVGIEPTPNSPVNGGAVSFSGNSNTRLQGKVPINGSHWTVSAWVMKRSHKVYNYPIFFSFGLPYLACNDGSVFRLSYTDVDRSQNNVVSNTVPELNRWYHVTGVSDGNGVHIYVDGQHEGTNTILGNSLAVTYNTKDIYIGRHRGRAQFHIDGAVADLKVFNRPLNAKQVEWLYKDRMTVDNLGGLHGSKFVPSIVIPASNFNRKPKFSEVYIKEDDVITNHSKLSSEYVQQSTGAHTFDWNLEYDIYVDEPGDYVVQCLIINENGTGRGVGMAIDNMTVNNWTGQKSRFDFTWVTCETYTFSKGKHVFKMCPGLDVKVKAIRFVGPGNVIHINPNVRRDGVIYGPIGHHGPTRGLIGHWRLGGDYRDLSKSGNDAEPSVDLPLATGPRYASSVVGHGEWIGVPGIRPGMMSRFTWSVWVKTTVIDGYLIMGSRNGNNTDISMAIVGGRLCIHKYTLDNASDSNHAISSTRVDDGQWHLLTVMYDEGQMTSYVDGVREGDGFHVNSRTINRMLTFNYDYMLGGTYDTRMFNGEMADARVYDVTLTDAEVNALYETTRPTSNDSVVVMDSGRVVRNGIDTLSSRRGEEVDLGFKVSKTLDRSVGGNHANAPLSENSPSLALDSNNNPFFKLDGIANYLEIPASDSLALENSTSGITVEAWIKGNDLGEIGSIWSCVDRYHQFILGPDGASKGMKFFIFSGTGGWSPSDYSDQSYNTENIDYSVWHHFAGVWDKSNGYIYFYVDGVLTHTVTNSSTSLAADDGPINIGRREGYVEDHYEGSIREVRIWNVARTGDEIRQNYQKTLTGGESGLVCYITP